MPGLKVLYTAYNGVLQVYASVPVGILVSMTMMPSQNAESGKNTFTYRSFFNPTHIKDNKFHRQSPDSAGASGRVLNCMDKHLKYVSM